METREIVSELYALRAGLSLIAKEKDTFDAEIGVAEKQKDSAITQARAIADNAIRNANEGVDSSFENKLDNARQNLDEAEFNLKKAHKAYYDNEEILHKNSNAKDLFKSEKDSISLCRKTGALSIILQIISLIMLPILLFVISPTNYGYFSIPFVVAALIIALFDLISFECGATILSISLSILNAIFMIIIMIMGFKSVSNGSFYWAIFVLTMIAIAACIGCTSYRLHKLDKTDDFRRKEQSMAEWESAKAKQSILETNWNDAGREYREAKQRYDEIKNIHEAILKKERDSIIAAAEYKYKNSCADAEKVFNAIYTTAAETHGKICSGIWDTLVRTYGNLLDVRDWGILDLVVWQLETGRAETLKEALQLADRETQTDRIVKTMQSASAAIAQRIDAGFGNLQTQLSNSFYTLAAGLAKSTSIISGQISRNSDILIGKIDESAQATTLLYKNQHNTMLATNKNLEQLFSQASLQTALLEKSNSSSKDLIDAVNRLRKAQNE